MRVALVLCCALFASVLAGCGGDNLSLCDGCENPTPTPVPTTTPTTTPTPTL
jgi:hypothetical protein